MCSCTRPPGHGVALPPRGATSPGAAGGSVDGLAQRDVARYSTVTSSAPTAGVNRDDAGHNDWWCSLLMMVMGPASPTGRAANGSLRTLWENRVGHLHPDPARRGVGQHGDELVLSDAEPRRKRAFATMQPAVLRTGTPAAGHLLRLGRPTAARRRWWTGGGREVLAALAYFGLTCSRSRTYICCPPKS
jgi:hypothetical protein